MTIRILLVDDHQMVREGLRALLSCEPEFEIVGEASDGLSALRAIRSLSPDVVIMDIQMPDLNGIEATRRICSEFEGTRVIALSAHFDRRYVAHMLEAGASAYVPKLDAHGELIRAVREVGAGRTYSSPEVAGLNGSDGANGKSGGDDSAYTRLSAREREVLQLVAEGKSSPATAKLMHISIKTVETHRRNIVKKLNVHGTAELTKYAVREGLTSLEY